MQDFVYLTMQEGVMIRDDGKKKIRTPQGNLEDPIMPRWSDPSLLSRTSDLNDLEKEMGPTAIHCGFSDVIVLDFDNEVFDEALALNNSLAKEYQCTSISKSVGKKGGHFMYKHQPNALTEFINNPNGCKLNQLDTLMGNCIVYATTTKNETKIPLVKGRELIHMPLAMQLLAISKYQEHKHRTVMRKEGNIYQSSKLGFIAERAKTDEEALYQMLEIITPIRFKEMMALSDIDKPTLHPDRVPDGNGYNYILALSGVLMKDPSVNKELHKQLIYKINDLFSTPLAKERVDNIYLRDIRSPEYCYNEDWKTQTYTVLTRNRHTFEVYAYYNAGGIHYLTLNTITNDIKTFTTASSLLDYIALTTGTRQAKDTILRQLNEVQVIARPDKRFGKLDNNLLNIYRQSKEQQVFYNPSKYKEEWTPSELSQQYGPQHPRYPKVTLGALRNACGAHTEMFLSFMARKFRTREHSPLFFVFYGVPHSFKSAIVKGVFSGLAKDRYASISIDMLVDKFNDWQVNKDLILLDEVHYIGQHQIKPAIQAINSISGSSAINGIRRMHENVDAKTYPQELTFILTTNEITKVTNEVNERRMVVFQSMTKVSEALGMTDLQIAEAIKAETVDFAYYLATMIDSAADDVYMRNDRWKGVAYHMFVEGSSSIEDKLVKAIVENDFKGFVEVFYDLGGNRQRLHDAIYFGPRGAYIRFYNSRPEVASHKALFTGADELLNLRMFMRKLSLCQNVSVGANDYTASKYNGNKITTLNLTQMLLKREVETKRKRPLTQLASDLLTFMDV